ncbi:MAG: malonyl-CoA decarboxylase [Pseudomonadota bacterium]
MSRTLFLQDILSNVFERGRMFRSEKDSRDIVELCDAILSEQGEVSGSKLAANILVRFQSMELEDKRKFFVHLVENLDLDPELIIEFAQAYAQEKSPDALKTLTKFADPQRRELLRRINQTPGATELLVGMREDLLKLLSQEPQLKCLDVDFEHLFTAWFNRGFLVLKPIDWKTPANILEKIIEYEAVHAINDWDDLRRRLQPEDRRCFAFFHPAMPEEPLIFVEVALTKQVPQSVNKLLAEERDTIDPNNFDTAVFYSISNCQKGLLGVSFGNFLIKQVLHDLKLEFPNLKNFVTLSPIPGFRKWLEGESANSGKEVLASIQKVLDISEVGTASERLAPYEKPMKVLLAKYFMTDKRRDGKPIDPVARFHLGNGASLLQFNWMADISTNGLNQSACMMVNYKYDISTVEENHENYEHEGAVNTTREIRSLAKQELK